MLIGGFDQQIAREVLGIPEKYKIVGASRYPEEEPPARPRKPWMKLSAMSVLPANQWWQV